MTIIRNSILYLKHHFWSMYFFLQASVHIILYRYAILERDIFLKTYTYQAIFGQTDFGLIWSFMRSLQAFIIYISLYSQKHRNSVSTAIEYTWKNVDDITQDPAATMNIGSHLWLRTGWLKNSNFLIGSIGS